MPATTPDPNCSIAVSTWRSTHCRHVVCPLLALSRHLTLHCTCPLLGVKRTLLIAAHMSASDPKRTCSSMGLFLLDLFQCRLDKGLHFWQRVAATGIDEVVRPQLMHFRPPLGQDRHELSGLDRISGQEVRQPCNTLAL